MPAQDKRSNDGHSPLGVPTSGRQPEPKKSFFFSFFRNNNDGSCGRHWREILRAVISPTKRIRAGHEKKREKKNVVLIGGRWGKRTTTFFMSFQCVVAVFARSPVVHVDTTRTSRTPIYHVHQSINKKCWMWERAYTKNWSCQGLVWLNSIVKFPDLLEHTKKEENPWPQSFPVVSGSTFRRPRISSDRCNYFRYSFDSFQEVHNDVKLIKTKGR